jgi:hypothetical protein
MNGITYIITRLTEKPSLGSRSWRTGGMPEHRVTSCGSIALY